MRENKMEKDIFKRRIQSKIMFAVLFLLLYFSFAGILGFKGEVSFLSIPEGIIWLFKNFIPTKNSMRYLPLILKSAVQTVLMAVTATTVSGFFALIMAVIGSETVGLHRSTKIFTKMTALFFRNTPVVAWALILLFSFKQSEFTGFLALFFVTFGYLVRTFAETIDEVAGDVVEALKSTGASYFQTVFQGVIPSIATQLVSWLLFYIENGVREATLIGVLTGTGIGFVFDLYYKSNRYDGAGLVIFIILIIVTGIELLSNRIRKEMM